VDLSLTVDFALNKMPSSSPFRIRLAELRDIPRITTVCLASLPDDPSFNFLWRYRHQYPDDSYFFWLQTFKGILYHPSVTFLVAEEPGPIDCEREDRGEAVATIFAFAIWVRNDFTTGFLHHLTTLYDHCSWATLHRKHPYVILHYQDTESIHRLSH
jgi:hypothetical protein